MGGGPASIYAVHTMDAIDQFFSLQVESDSTKK